MKRFIDLRGQETGYRFAWYDTIIDKFETFSDSMAWDTWEEFRDDYLNEVGSDEIERYRRLTPNWALDVNINNC